MELAPNNQGAVIVAGHICLDIIPTFPTGTGVSFQPGQLVEAGRAVLSTGGAVSNTGLCLTKLGVPTTLIGKVGADPFGRAIQEILDAHQPGLSRSMTVVEGEDTSYTIVLNLTGHDRMFLHSPGCNNTFTSSDVSDDALNNASLLHFGYPPLMAQMYAEDGQELVDLFRRAKSHGLLTSLDLSLPDANSPSGQANWQRILERVLPYVDIFAPSVDELSYMLGDPNVDDLANQALQMGAKIVALKAGHQGLYLFTAKQTPLGKPWDNQKRHAPCFQVEVAGTTGSGDATIGGLLMAILKGMPPEEALTAAVAAGACCCEAPDAVSGVRSWSEIEARIQAGWPRLTAQ